MSSTLDATAYRGILLGQRNQITSQIALLQNDIVDLSKKPSTVQVANYVNEPDGEQTKSLLRDSNGNWFNYVTRESDASKQITVDKSKLVDYQNQLKTLSYQIDGNQQVITSTSAKTFASSTGLSPVMLIAIALVAIMLVGKL